MMKTHSNSLPVISFDLVSFLGDFLQLTKFRLAVSVVFSSVAGYLIAVDQIEVSILFGLIFGGFAMVGASNAFNQWIERDKDALMDRTKNRPLPTGRINNFTALLIASLLTLLGILILNNINFKTAFFGALSIIIYTCIYTPLKSLTSLSVFVGAFPGAIPFMLGWVAATGNFGIEPGVLFMVQFFWQFPHFWALCWKLDDDYKLAGFILLPSGYRDKKSAFQIMLYAAFLIPVTMLPWVVNMSGYFSMLFGVLASLCMLIPAIRLYISLDMKYAKQVMFLSFVYLPFVLLVYYLDKI